MFLTRNFIFLKLKILVTLTFAFSMQLMIIAQKTGSLQRSDTLGIAALVPKTGVIVTEPALDLSKVNDQGTDLYVRLKQAAYKRYWTKKLHNIVIKSSSKTVSDTLKVENSAEPFEKYKNKIIRNISIKQLEIFGSSVIDTSQEPISWIESTSNKLHIQTSARIIYNQILFKKGDKLSPLKLSDNESVIRNLPFIEDVRILIKENSSLSDSVDIVVITKDVIPFGFDLSLNKGGSGKIQLWNKNLFGLGRENSNDLFWDKNKHYSGFDEYYTINNIAGSFINSNFEYIKANGTETVGMNATRDFFTPNTKYAGGININHTSTITAIYLPDSIRRDTARLNYFSYDFWLGRSFSLRSDNQLAKHSLKLVTAIRFTTNEFYRAPELSENIFYKYQDRNIVLGSIGLSRQNNYKTNLIYNFGRTEDIPYGFLIKATGGFERNQFTRRYYTSLSTSVGGLIDAIGYGYLDIEGGGFYNKNVFQQGMIKLTGNYFSNLFIINQFKIRNFININYIEGLQRFKDEYLTIDNNTPYGIQGLNDQTLTGQQKLNVNLETVYFSPYNYYGFRFAFFSFINLGMIGPDYKLIFNNELYSSIGLGVRIRNEKLVFKTLQIRLAFFPNPPKGALKDYIYLSGEDLFNPNNFFVKEPDLLQFQ